MKWIPAPLWLVLPPRARGWGLVFLALAGLLSLAMLPLTIVQFQVIFGFTDRPARADYLVFIWSAVPWWWERKDPFAFLRPSSWPQAASFQAARARRWVADLRADPRGTTRAGWAWLHAWGGRFLGLDEASRRPGPRGSPEQPPITEIGD
jgi:hypothetical protein